MRNDKYFVDALEKIKQTIKKLNIKGTVYIFGSSIRDDYLKTSDIDLAIKTKNTKDIAILRYELEELNIPYKVDLIDLTYAANKLKEIILKEGIILWKK
jgi:predicted nucleotidyltransferase